MSGERPPLYGIRYKDGEREQFSILARKRARSRQYPELAPYFEMTDIEDKADFIASVRSRWPTHSGGLSPAPLDAAVSLLDERSVSFPVHGGAPAISAA
jgi:hypothetical protein